MKIQDFEIFKFGENQYTEFINNGNRYLLNKSPYLDIVLSDYCNADCSFCIADLIHDKLQGDIEIFKKKILFAIERMNVKEVLLLGGEPTMSKNLIPMIKWLASLSLDKIVMTTNGLRLAKNQNYLTEVLSSGLTHVNVSFMNVIPERQQQITNAKTALTLFDIKTIFDEASKSNVNIRINNNVFYSNNDSLKDIIDFYEWVSPYCNSVKFSPLLETDSFSVVDYKTEWARCNRLSDRAVYELFTSIENYYTKNYNVSVIENDLQFGFVKNSMIPLRVPIILNWNFGEYTGMMKKVVNEGKINNIKLLPNNQLSLSWNRELPKYFIITD